MSPRTSVDNRTGEIIIKMVFSPYLGKEVPARCRKCFTCRIVQAKQRAYRIYQSHPTHVVTLTQAGEDYQQIAKRMERYRARMLKLFPTYEHCWSAEPTASGGSHVHLYARVDDRRLPKEAIEKAWPHGRVAVAPMPQSFGPAYTGYTMKLTADAGQAQTFFDLNSSSEKVFLTHQSRGFFS
jgi:hypothetical protein